MAPRRKFDLDTLDDCLERDRATTDFERSLPIKSTTLIEFVCKCGKDHSKRLDNAVDYGMFCPECLAKETVVRSKASALRSKQNVVEQAEQYVLELDDGTREVLHHTEKVTLVVAAKFLSQAVSKCSYGNNQDYMIAKYWSIVDECVRTKKFRILDGNNEEQEAKARLFLETIQVIPAAYTIVRTMEELSEKASWSQKHLRLAPTIIEYEEREVPIDTYLLSTWLGDGSAGKAELTNIEPEITKYWQDYAMKNNFGLTLRPDGIHYNIIDPCQKKNRLMDALRQEGIFYEKAVPRIYIENSESVRMTFLAGLLDTDGTKNYSGKNNSGVSYEFSQCVAHEAIFDGFREIVHSLGWRMAKTRCIKQCTGKDGVKKSFPAFRGSIIGDDRLQDIPVLVPRKKITRSSQARRDLLKFTVKNT